MFLLPSFALLGALVVWPALATIYRSFFADVGGEFVGTDNYEEIFSNPRLRKAIANTFIWVGVFPLLTTTVGLLLAVLSERMRAKAAFRALLFMPAALALLSSGIIWRLVYNESPDLGVANAAIAGPQAFLSPEGPLAGAIPSTDDVTVEANGALRLQVTAATGETASIGLVRLSAPEEAAGVLDATAPGPQPGALVGTVWRDTKPGSNTKGEIEAGEIGLGGVQVLLLSEDGSARIASAITSRDGVFRFRDVTPGSYIIEIPASEFQPAWSGITWLGPDLITFSAVVAGLWVWGGFALLVIASGLAALPDEVLEAARLDGASELQVFRHVTAPLLRPVLTVVFVALTINALKMFDLIIGIAPGSVQDEANTIALEMWRTSFTGLGRRGLGSAVAVFLFVLAIPIMALNIRRFRLEDKQ